MKAAVLCVLLSFVLVAYQIDPRQSTSESDISTRVSEEKTLFEAWIIQHGKVYASAEEKEMRFKRFQESIIRTTLLNQRTEEQGSGANYGLTKFSDMSPREFRTKVLMTPRHPSPKPPNAPHFRYDCSQLPTTLDWRGKATTPVKDQGQCGSCWAFSATETVESAWILAHNLTGAEMQPLSPQQIVDCDGADDGCGGGDTPSAYAYIMSQGGLDTSSQYPYTAEDGTCKYKQPPYAGMSGWQYATTVRDEGAMRQAAVQQGPLSICLDAANWQDYTGGVLTAWQCAWINTLDHCVQIVGYNMESSPNYWIVRNSWGTSWGINGYIYLEYGENTCGLANEATYVVSSTKP